MMLFKLLLKVDAVEYNPLENIDKEKPIKKKKRLLTDAEGRTINDHFLSTDVYYFRFLHIFFHSGTRPKELLRMKKQDINLYTWIRFINPSGLKKQECSWIWED